MEEKRTYKWNERRITGKAEGTLKYYFYKDDGLGSIDVSEEQFDKLVKLDTEMYNSDRREFRHHTSARAYLYHTHKLTPDIKNEAEAEEALPDKNYEEIFSDVIEKADEDSALSELSDEDREIYQLIVRDGFSQAEVAKRIGKTQSYIAKRLVKITDTVNLAKSAIEEKNIAYADMQWEKYLETHRTDNDEDIVFDMYHALLPTEEIEKIMVWFSSFREYYKFGLTYLIIRPFDKYDELEFGNRSNELPYENRYFLNICLCEQPDEIQWLYLAYTEEVLKRKKRYKAPPSQRNYEKIINEADRIGKRLNMTGEEFWEKRAAPKYAEFLRKRYLSYRKKNFNVFVYDETDTRPIWEQLKEAFGDGEKPVPNKYRKNI